MKSRVAIIVLVCVTGALLLFTYAAVTSTDQKAATSAAVLPSSLDNLYPPVNPAPVYLLGMYGLARPFSGMVCDVLENDMENALSNFEAFRKAYVENSALVPEWQPMYAMDPVDQLGAAITTGDPSKIMPAVDALGRVCHGCHVAKMVPVQQKFRWDSFAGFALTDPLSGADVSFAQLMLMMETNFDGIASNLQQGQKENALAQFAGFNARFQAMADACVICHDSERHYYVSEDITGLISNLQVELSKPAVDMATVGGLLQSIGQESCSKCHLVHIPAAYGQQMMEMHK